MGELVPNNTDGIQHALKWEGWAKMYYYHPNDGNHSECFRWPAMTCDGCWTDCYGGVVSETRMGSLLAIPPNISQYLLDNDMIKTEPAKMMLKTLTNYGAYIVDDSAWDQQQYCAEYGVGDEFEKVWGYPFLTGSPFADDMVLISKYFHVVNNNGPESIGGGGALRANIAPPIGN